MAQATKRARDDAGKVARREAVLDVAESLFARLAYDAITMAEVAERCRLAKGTLYLYFPTKEAMFLALYMRHARSFAVELVATAEAATSFDDLARRIAGALANRPQFLKLMTMVHAVLEENIDKDVAASFKRDLVAGMALPARALERCFPVLSEGDGVRFLIRLSALAVGLAEMANPNPVVAAALDEDPALHPLRVDFKSEFAGALAAMLRGWRSSGEPAV